LKADLKKKHILSCETVAGKEKYFKNLKYFCYAVSADLKEEALAQIPDFCGLWVAENILGGRHIRFHEIRAPKHLFSKVWTDKDRHYLARLGAMRIHSLKTVIQKIKK